MTWSRRAAIAAVAVAVIVLGVLVVAGRTGSHEPLSTPTPATATATASASPATTPGTVPPAWVGSWAAAPEQGTTGFARQTLRQIVHTSIGGSGARLRISNRFGARSLTVRDVRLARRAGGSRIDAGADRPVTFGGAGSVTVPAGDSAASDAVGFSVPANGDLAVSFYLPTATGPATRHALAERHNYVGRGEQSGAAAIVGASTTSSYYFLVGLDVRNRAATGAVVALGASITDGLASSFGAYRRWPDLLARRLASAGRTVGVLNAGISGNRLLTDGAGESALARFDRDVLAQPGVRWVIFSDLPLNDLGGRDPPTADQVIAGLRKLIERSHAAGLQFFCSTLTPFEGAGYWTEGAETRRAAINAFLRGSASGCDDVIDQDDALRDPAAPTRYRARYDSGDHLHPNDRGMQAIADAIQPTRFD